MVGITPSPNFVGRKNKMTIYTNASEVNVWKEVEPNTFACVGTRQLKDNDNEETYVELCGEEE